MPGGRPDYGQEWLGQEQGQESGSLEGHAKGLRFYQVGTGTPCPVLFTSFCLSLQICFEDS